MTDKAWFRRLLRHLTMKWNRSILSTLEPAWGIDWRLLCNLHNLLRVLRIAPYLLVTDAWCV